MSAPAASTVNTPLEWDALPLTTGAPMSALSHGPGSVCALPGRHAARITHAVRSAAASVFRALGRATFTIGAHSKAVAECKPLSDQNRRQILENADFPHDFPAARSHNLTAA